MSLRRRVVAGANAVLWTRGAFTTPKNSAEVVGCANTANCARSHRLKQIDRRGNCLCREPELDWYRSAERRLQFVIAHAQATVLGHVACECRHLVIFFSGVVGSVVDLVVAVPLLSVVDVAWSGVGSVFAPGTPVAPPWLACSGVGLVFTPGTPVAPP